MTPSTGPDNSTSTVSARVLQKLEWPQLLERLADECQTSPGRSRCLGLQPNLNEEGIRSRWAVVAPLRPVVGQGYRPPIGDLPEMGAVLRAARLGQVLNGEDLRFVFTLLESTQRVADFCKDFAERSVTLKKIRGQLYPMSSLMRGIERAVTPGGTLRDDASEELQRVRRQKVSLRKRIEEQLKQILHKSDLEPYLQDDFYTVRSERYVVPMRLDGRGRVKGSILDTSDSGQTLYIEPAAIAGQNDQLLELELAEKLEVLRIFRSLSQDVAGEAETLAANADELVKLDAITAEAAFAAQLDAGEVELINEPIIDLKQARHPLLDTGGKGPVANTIQLASPQRTLIVSGPNAGGKTVVLKTTGLLHLMVRAGLLVPADHTSKMHLFDRIDLEMGDAQNLSANLSTFSGHLLGLKPILEEASPNSLVLLDELAVGTDPQTGAAIAQSALEHLAMRAATTVVTTHFDSLKGLAVQDERFRNGSMEFSLESLRPTYRLILDVPGQSYGLEVAEQLGLPADMVSRAKNLRGATVSALDDAVSQLMAARDEARNQQQEAERLRLEAEAEKARWEHEAEVTRTSRREVSERLASEYDRQIAEMRREFEELNDRLKKQAKQSAKGINQDDRRQAEQKLRGMEKLVRDMGDAGGELPGQPATIDQMKAGTKVHVLPLKKQGVVLSRGQAETDPIEVEVGMLKLRLNLHDLRLVKAEASKTAATSNKSKPAKTSKAAPSRPAAPVRLPREGTPDDIGLTLQTHTNSLDLRGQDIDSAISKMWNFVDRAMLRGETAVVLIHGHGTDKLKVAVREALRTKCPYEDVRFRAGIDQEGGDGVTVVQLAP